MIGLQAMRKTAFVCKGDEKKGRKDKMTKKKNPTVPHCST